MANAALKIASEHAFTTTYTPRGTKKEVTLPGINAFSGDILGLPANDTAVKAPETDHARVFRLVAEKKYEAAAFLAARLINSGQADGFFIYGTGNTARRAQNWFDDQVIASRKSVITVVQNITPELAQVVLSNNSHNRRVNVGNLARLMRDIASGRWDLNGQTIGVARTSRVNDGQHRCFAVLLTGISIKSAVVFGVSEDSMGTVDIGRKRTGADRLSIAGEKDAIIVAAVAALDFEVRYGRAPTSVEVDEYYAENATEIRAAVRARGQNVRGIGPTAAAVAALYLLKNGYQADSIRKFFATVKEAENTKNGNAARTLHKALFPTGRDASPLRMKRDEWVATLYHHYSAWVRNQRVDAPIKGKPLPKVY